jgi:hypothetical protein
MNIPSSEAIKYLHSIMGKNKAKGLLAQLEFRKWVRMNLGDEAQKSFEGCWILPAKELPYSRRVCFFVHPTILADNQLDETVNQLLRDRGFQGLCSSLKTTGLGVVYYIATSDRTPSIERLKWTGYFYSNSKLLRLDQTRTYKAWGGSGRPGLGKPWESPTEVKYSALSPEELTAILLPQAFYNKLLKQTFKISTPDPYDCDGFIVSYDGRVFPLEIKEKSPFGTGSTQKLGIDAGRLLMLLRICMPLDANAFYIVRELESGATRKFSKWKYISLDDVVMKSSWNLQPGGLGMGGGGTSTIILPYDAFGDLSSDTFSDDALKGLSPMSVKVKQQAAVFAKEIEGRLYRQSSLQT